MPRHLCKITFRERELKLRKTDRPNRARMLRIDALDYGPYCLKDLMIP
jgi:hypothetical protein